MLLESIQQRSYAIRNRLRVTGEGFPFDEFDVRPVRVDRTKNPGAYIRGDCGFAHSPPVGQVCGGFAGYSSDRGLEVAAQRNSQKMPMTMVLTPVSWPNMRAHFSDTTAARPIR
jgi:hypothetical protein